MIMTSDSSLKTRAVAKEFAGGLQAGSIVALIGDLASGKTEFVKGMAEAFEIDPSRVVSPTFTLLNIYEGRAPWKAGEAFDFCHFDWYRIKNRRELEEMGAEDYHGGSGISAIEWYDKRILEIRDCLIVTLRWLADSRREITLPG